MIDIVLNNYQPIPILVDVLLILKPPFELAVVHDACFVLVYAS